MSSKETLIFLLGDRVSTIHDAAIVIHQHSPNPNGSKGKTFVNIFQNCFMLL